MEISRQCRHVKNNTNVKKPIQPDFYYYYFFLGGGVWEWGWGVGGGEEIGKHIYIYTLPTLI